ncbi:hypothetical protein GCM10009799_06490 [Nocardiopsis rhodophaea]|uniref:Uncharacterized protein n=1 Tax=Nocardiopsis rhodophaea TaxID=280238 RepID=A0ABN2SC07_9ACTN
MSFPRDASPWQRLISPSGIGLVLICLFLPFIGVSCETSLGTLDVQASGWDLAVGGEPSVFGTGVLERDVPHGFDPAGGGASVRDKREDVGVHPLMLVGILSLLTGAVLGIVLPSRLARALGGLATGALALVLFSVNEVLVYSTLEEQLAAEAVWLSGSAEVGTRFGFWVTIAVLIAVGAFNANELRAAAQQSRPLHGGPPYGPVPPPPVSPQPPPHTTPPPHFGGPPPWQPGPPSGTRPPGMYPPPSATGRDDPYGPPYG